jgi:drug/metabolite transporter (DMT)-like permease
VTVVLLSLFAAFAFALGAVLQQHAAAGQPLEHNMRPSLVVRLVQRPMWLAGIGMNGFGTLLQLAALWRGSLVTVQPLLVCGLIFAIPINAMWLHRRRPGVRESISAGAVCVGLTAFLLATAPTPGRGTASPVSWFIALGALFVVTAIPIAAALRSRGPLRAGLLAVAAGVVNGLSAAFIKGIARQIEHSIHSGLVSAAVGLMENWELYAFGLTLLFATLLVQSAYQSGPIRWSLPALTAANPVTSVILGACVLSEQISTDPIAIAGAVIGLGLVVGGIMALSSSSLITGEIGHEGAVTGADVASLAMPGDVVAEKSRAVDPAPAIADATE